MSSFSEIFFSTKPSAFFQNTLSATTISKSHLIRQLIWQSQQPHLAKPQTTGNRLACDNSMDIVYIFIFLSNFNKKVWLCPNTFILPYPIAGYAPHMRTLGRKAIWIGTKPYPALGFLPQSAPLQHLSGSAALSYQSNFRT